MKTMLIERLQVRLVLGLFASFAAVSALPARQTEAAESVSCQVDSQSVPAPDRTLAASPKLKLVRNADGGSRMKLVRRSTRMARRGRCCPQAQAENCVVAAGSLTEHNQHGDLKGRGIVKVSDNTILNTKNESYRLNMANRLWAQSGFHFEPQFVRSIHEHYGAGLGEVDFAETEQARQTINHWVAESTNGKIADLIPPDILHDKIRLVLTNAIYFKGTWQYQFSKTETKEAPFFLSKDRKINVPMMQQQTGGLRYAQADDIQLLELPFAGGDLSLVILLPKQVDGLGVNKGKESVWTSRKHRRLSYYSHSSFGNRGQPTPTGMTSRPRNQSPKADLRTRRPTSPRATSKASSLTSPVFR